MKILSERQCRDFVHDGFVLVEGVFDRGVAEAGCEVVWDAIGRHARGWSSPEHPVAWFDNFVHLQYGWRDGPFAQAGTSRLHGIFDDLLGPGRWRWDHGFGWWPVLFPSFAANKAVRDLGWHVDSDDDHPTLRVPEKAVVAIFYFSDAGEGDGGTAVFRGSHLEVARLLADADPLALKHEDVRPRLPRPSSDEHVLEVTGNAGDVLFAHPFLVHASNRNTGSPRPLRVQPARRPARSTGLRARRGRTVLGRESGDTGARGEMMPTRATARGHCRNSRAQQSHPPIIGTPLCR
ncbi:MAG: hypothetical protein QOI20_469 [Acidimicrobiaceae bacterium]|nr:hypothetical protein [Acidimicrobiaceae bacterium]